MKNLTLSDIQRMGANIVSVGPSVVVPDERPKGRGRTQRTSGMNKLESRYAVQLESEKQAGTIAGYWYEPLKLRLADKTFYSPDFMVMMPDGTIEFRETKGHWEDDARVKWKVAAEQFWMFSFVAITIVKGQWKYERYKEQP